MSGNLDRDEVIPRVGRGSRPRKRVPARLSVVLETLIRLVEQGQANPILLIEARAWLANVKAREDVMDCNS